MRSFLSIVALGLMLAGCSTLQKDYAIITGATVSTAAVTVAGNSFDALEATATNYLSLPRCSGTNGPICRDPKATAALIPAIRSARLARNNLEAFLVANPGQLGPTGLYNALTASLNTLEAIFSQYNVKVSS